MVHKTKINDIKINSTLTNEWKRNNWVVKINYPLMIVEKQLELKYNILLLFNKDIVVAHDSRNVWKKATVIMIRKEIHTIIIPSVVLKYKRWTSFIPKLLYFTIKRIALLSQMFFLHFVGPLRCTDFGCKCERANHQPKQIKTNHEIVIWILGVGLVGVQFPHNISITGP